MQTKKIAMVTGASNGIGESVSKFLASINYHVILIARNKEKLKYISQTINSTGGKASFIPADISDYAAVCKLVDSVFESYAQIDVLVNSAGVTGQGTSNINIEEIDKMIKTNLLGTIYFCKQVAKYMKKQKSGYIFNLSSLGGKISRPNMGIYNSTKFGVLGFSNALFKELMPYGIKVTSLCPGVVATEMAKKVLVNSKISSKNCISLHDINYTIGYLLNLSANVSINEIIMHCTKMTVLEETAKLDCLKMHES